MEPKTVLAVCLNPAWQKTLRFSSLRAGGVNRAQSQHEAGGGKGVNVARVFRLLGLPVALAGFAGGWSGQKLRDELASSGVVDLTVSTTSCTRCCYTVIDGEKGQATELIEPSGTIREEEFDGLLDLVRDRIGGFGAIALCGSMAPGVPATAYGSLAALAQEAGIPLVLDSVQGLEHALTHAVKLLKINRNELHQLTGEAQVLQASAQLLDRYPTLGWLAVTDGGNPGMICSREGSWRVRLPQLEKVVSPIGGGDCATAIMTRRLAEGWDGPLELPQAFAEALACASASCLTDTPSVFDGSVASELLSQSIVERV